MFRKYRLLRGAVLLASMLLAMLPWYTAAADSHGAKAPAKIRVEIKDNGFNDQPDFTLEVEQGQVVELTFVFAQSGALGDGHVIVLKGYGLETDEISFYNKEATLKFVADKGGTFEFACDLDCEIHDKLKKGHLKVKGAAGAGGGGVAAAALMPTVLSAYPSAWEVTGAPVKLSASLKDNSGGPVAKATVHFFIEREFAGTKGKMEIGAGRTDANGMATVSYKPTFAGAQQITAHFEGMGLYSESAQSFQLQVRSVDPAYTVAPRGLEGVADRVPIVFVAVILSIWSTFAFVLYQVFRIQRANKRAVAEGEPSIPTGSLARAGMD